MYKHVMELNKIVSCSMYNKYASGFIFRTVSFHSIVRQLVGNNTVLRWGRHCTEAGQYLCCLWAVAALFGEAVLVMWVLHASSLVTTP